MPVLPQVRMHGVERRPGHSGGGGSRERHEGSRNTAADSPSSYASTSQRHAKENDAQHNLRDGEPSLSQGPRAEEWA